MPSLNAVILNEGVVQGFAQAKDLVDARAERYMDNEIRTEQPVKKEDEEEGETSEIEN